jgi:hypothetical protein
VKKVLPILVALFFVVIGTYIVVQKKSEKSQKPLQLTGENIGSFDKQKKCVVLPKFLQKMQIPQPIVIDLTQKRFKGIALQYGKDLKGVLHPKQWEQFEHFGTYTLDEKGNIYLIPMPYISILPTTFNLQKNLYRLDTQTGKVSIFMHFDDVLPTAKNPYGLQSIAYDCDDKTLWIAAIDESNYQKQKGIIYQVDPKTKSILRTIKGFDALSLSILKTDQSKFLLLGSARDNGLYKYDLLKQDKKQKPVKIVTLPNDNEHIRKIKIKGNNTLELQTIPFSYTLIAQTAKQDRMVHSVKWNEQIKKWNIN